MLTILWDNDGVLVDTEGLYFRATRTVLAEVGVELTPEQFKEISLKRGESTFSLAGEQGISLDEIVRLRAKRDRIYTDFLRTEPCLIDGAEEVLRALHGQVRMGVVTSTHRQHFDIAHARTGLAKYLDFVIAHGDYQHSKPHPEPYLTALARHQLRPKEVYRGRGFRARVGVGHGSGIGMPDCVERMDEGRGLPQSPEGAGQHCRSAG